MGRVRQFMASLLTGHIFSRRDSRINTSQQVLHFSKDVSEGQLIFAGSSWFGWPPLFEQNNGPAHQLNDINGVSWFPY